MSPKPLNPSLLIAAFLSCLVLLACSGEPPLDNRLITTYASVLIIRESTVDSTQSKRRCDSVLEANSYTTETFEKALREQSEDRERMKVFYDSVVARVKTIRAN